MSVRIQFTTLKRLARFRTVFLTVIAVLLPGGVSLSGATQRDQVPPTPLHQKLSEKTSVNVRDVTCHDFLRRLSGQSGIPIIRDRRINPSTALTLKTDLVSTKRLLNIIAGHLPDAGVSYGDSYVYIGPLSSARTLQTLIELRRKQILDARSRFPNDAYRRLIASTSSPWADASSPRQLILSRAGECGLAITNAEIIPHDLWRADSLPVIPFAEFASIVLTQFDLTFDVSAGDSTMTIVPQPDSIVIEKRHGVPRRRRTEVERWLTDQSSGVNATWQRASVLVTARIEIHQQITRLIQSGSVETSENNTH